MSLKKWIESKRELVLTGKIFRYWKVARQSQDSKQSGEFDIIQCAPWVNIVALTDNQKMIMVRQYRQGTDEMTLEFPGGAIDFAEEEPLIAAQRELQEETGYVAREWQILGQVSANPAFMTNHCTTFLAKGAVKKFPQKLDPCEEIEIVEFEVHEIPELIRNGKIHHSLIVAGFYLYQLNTQVET